MPPHSADLEKLLRFFQDLYTHALTLQEFTRAEYARSYDDIKPQFDAQAAEEFAVLYGSLEDPKAFAKAVREFLDGHPTIGGKP